MIAMGYAASGSAQSLEKIEYELAELLSDEVRIQVEYCSLCFSDIDVLDDVFGLTIFPAIAGHEIVGRVIETGSAVRHVKRGDRVGVGPQRGACLQCRNCIQSQEQVCRETVSTAAHDYPGGFGEMIQVPEAFAFSIPESLDPEQAAPLMCAGLTVFSALSTHARGAEQTGILGVGGLGHLAIQFSRAMGHEVTAFALNPSDTDREFLQELGAGTVIDTADSVAVKAARESMDFILSTVHGTIDFKPYVAALRQNGRMALVGNTPGPLGDIIKHLVLGQRGIVGSAQGNRDTMRRMLAFAEQNDIRCVIESLPMSQINDAIARLRRSDVRYRFVLKAGE